MSSITRSSPIRAPIERAVAHLKTWKILFADYRRPLNTFLGPFWAVIGLYFFELSFQFFITLKLQQRPLGEDPGQLELNSGQDDDDHDTLVVRAW